MIRKLAHRFSSLKLFQHKEIPQNLSVDRPYNESTLSNGIRVCTEHWPSPLSHITVYIKCGSRDETEETSGAAHFLEHLHFKGTGRRGRERLETDVENFGGQLNAYTSRENTSYTINCYKEKTEDAVEILGDMLTNSVYAKSDIERERHTIYRELFETRKMQFETSIEVSHRGAYKGHQMSLPILGKIQNMYSITRDMIHKYHSDNYFGENIIVCGVGNVNHDQLCEYVLKHFHRVKNQNTNRKINKPAFQTETFLMQSELTNDVNVCIFHEGPEWIHPQYYNFLVLQRMLGDRPTNMLEAAIFESSNLNTFQKKMLKYEKILTQKAAYIPYKDTALFGNYFVAEPENIADCIKVQEEIYQEYAHKVNSEELQRAKRRLFIELCQHETGNDISQAISNQVLYFDRRIYRQEIAQNLANLSEQDIQQTVKDWLINKPYSLNLWGNIEPIMKQFNFSRDQIGTH